MPRGVCPGVLATDDPWSDVEEISTGADLFPQRPSTISAISATGSTKQRNKPGPPRSPSRRRDAQPYHCVQRHQPQAPPRTCTPHSPSPNLLNYSTAWVTDAISPSLLRGSPALRLTPAVHSASPLSCLTGLFHPKWLLPRRRACSPLSAQGVADLSRFTGHNTRVIQDSCPSLHTQVPNIGNPCWLLLQNTPPGPHAPLPAPPRPHHL